MITSERLAIIAHGNQKYGDHPYDYHLSRVVKVLQDYGFTDRKWVDAGWLHDALEDTMLTVHDLTSLYDLEVADMIVCVSGYGKNRKERQADILNKLQFNKDACILKLADRIVNVGFSLHTTNEIKFEMYKSEQEAFAKVVQPNVPQDMWEELKNMFK
jgi:(p)ppGpp synthase/HD superfamily hydrolase